MFRRLILALLVLSSISATACFAQTKTTSVTITTLDGDSQSWNNGTYSTMLVANFGTSTLVGSPGPSGALNGSGGATFTVTSNNDPLFPVGGMWQVTICPQMGCSIGTTNVINLAFTQSLGNVIGTTMTIPIVPPALRLPIFTQNPLKAYLDAEVTQAGLGNQYFNLTTGQLKYCSALPCVAPNWVAPGGGSSAVVSAFGRTGAIVGANGDYTVSQVTGAAPSANPTFTGTVTTPALDVTGVNGLVQCAHFDAAGNVTGTGSDCGSAAGAFPAGNVGDLQSKLSPSAFQATSINDNGSTVAINENLQTKGPNPVFDVMRYGGYEGPLANLSTTGTVTNTPTNGSASDPLTTTGPLSSNWTTFLGSWTIASGALAAGCPGGQLCEAEWTGTPFQPDQTATLTMVNFANQNIGPIVRMTNSANYYSFRSGGSTWFLVKMVAGNQTVLFSGSHTPVNGDIYSLSIVGSTLTAKINGSTVQTATDTSLTSGQPGIFAFSSATGTVNTFSASWTLNVTTVAISSALDFANGQGVNVLGAGPATTLTTPTGVTATAQGITGSTSYNYCVVDEDFANGKTPCSAAGTISNATASFGVQSVTLTGCTRVSGVVTCTTSAPHNFVSGYQVELPRNTFPNGNFEGTFTTTSASGSTFTFNQYGVADASVGAGTARTAANILVRWNYNLSAFVAKHLIYRCSTSCTLPANAANYTLIGVAVGQDSSFLDMGFGIVVAGLDNGDGPATAPTTASNQWLPTTITSGGSTTTITLAAIATNIPSGVKVLHDNATPLNNACFGAGTIYIPQPTAAGYYFPITSTWNGCNEVDVNAPLYLNAPIVPQGGSYFKGLPGGNPGQLPPFYNLNPPAYVAGNAYPFFLMKLAASNNLHFQNFLMQCFAAYQPCIEQDEGGDSSAVAGIQYDIVHLQSNGASTPYIAKGGFGFWWNGGGWSSSPSSFASPVAALFTGNCGLGSQSQLPGIVRTKNTYSFGGVLWDACGQTLLGTDGPTNTQFDNMLVEGAYGPAIRYNTAANLFYGVYYDNLGYSDYLGGGSSPLIDLTNSQVTGLRFVNPLCATGTQPMLEVASGANYHGIQVNGMNCTYTGTQTSIMRAGDTDTYTNSFISFNSGGKAFYSMAAPAAPVSAVVSAGGAVPVGAHTYQVTALDPESGMTALSAAISATTTTGNQTVTVTLPSLPAGAAGMNLYRDGVAVAANSCVAPQFTTSGAVYVDSSTPCGNSPYGPNAGTSIFSSVGLTAPKATIFGTATVNSILPRILYSAAGTALPTCNAGINGETAVVSDATTPTYMAAYASGGAITTAVICSFNGSVYGWKTQ